MRLTKLPRNTKAKVSALALASLLAMSVTPVPAQKSSSPDRDRAVGQLEVVATFNGPMPTGVTVSNSGRIFVNFPRWGDDVPFTVAELVKGKAVAYPNAEVNDWPGRLKPNRPNDPDHARGRRHQRLPE